MRAAVAKRLVHAVIKRVIEGGPTTAAGWPQPERVGQHAIAQS
ncbi:MAG: hypothetical protein ABI339_08825 [Solirubrobacteraceae bacterium]